MLEDRKNKGATAQLERLDPTVAIRLENLTRELFISVLRTYDTIAKAELSEAKIQELAERDPAECKRAMRDGSNSEEWRLGSSFTTHSKLKLSTVIEWSGKTPNPAIFFWFDPNTGRDNDKHDQNNIKNNFLIAVEKLLLTTGNAIDLKNSGTGPYLD
jgi:hypothetical protein